MKNYGFLSIGTLRETDNPGGASLDLGEIANIPRRRGVLDPFPFFPPGGFRQAVFSCLNIQTMTEMEVE